MAHGGMRWSLAALVDDARPPVQTWARRAGRRKAAKSVWCVIPYKCRNSFVGAQQLQAVGTRSHGQTRIPEILEESSLSVARNMSDLDKLGTANDANRIFLGTHSHIVPPYP